MPVYLCLVFVYNMGIICIQIFAVYQYISISGVCINIEYLYAVFDILYLIWKNILEAQSKNCWNEGEKKVCYDYPRLSYSTSLNSTSSSVRDIVYDMQYLNMQYSIYDMICRVRYIVYDMQYSIYDMI